MSDPLHQLALLRDLPAADRAALWAQGTPARFEKGATVFKQGARADHALLVVSGRLKAWAEEGSRSQPVSDVYPGELVGEAALYGRASTRTATLKAWAPTVGLRLTRDDLDALATSPAVAAIQRHMLETTARRLRTTNHAARHLWARGPVEVERVARSQSIPVRGDDADSTGEPASVWDRLGRLLGRLA